MCRKLKHEKDGWMSQTYTVRKEAINKAVENLKEAGLVSRDAFFNHDAPDNLRREIAFRDFDFLARLARVSEREIAASAFEWLKQSGIIPKISVFDEQVFERFRKDVKEKFNIPGTSITPAMERLLYMLSAVKKPKRVIGLGTYCGYALVWVVGASCGETRTYKTEKVYGIDIDEASTEKAQANFAKLAQSDPVEFRAQDGLEAVVEIDGPFDYVYLDVDSRELGKGIYFDLLTRLYEKIEEDGWVLAHDTCVPTFAGQLREYLVYVRNENNFRESISFDIDPFGLELSIK
jgi:predicted O-methyltransferase YrrM